MTARTSSHEPSEGCACTWKEQSADALTKSLPGVPMRNTMESSGYLYLTERSKGQMKLSDS